MPISYLDDELLGGPGATGPQLPPPPPDVPMPDAPLLDITQGDDIADALSLSDTTSEPSQPQEDLPPPPPPAARRVLSNVPLAEPGATPGVGPEGRSSHFFESLPGRGLGANPLEAGSPLAAGMGSMDDPRRRLPDDETMRMMILGG